VMKVPIKLSKKRNKQTIEEKPKILQFPPEYFGKNRAAEVMHQGFALADDFRTGHAYSISQLAEEKRTDRSYILKQFRFYFLAPDIQAMILEGRQPPHLTLEKLKTFFPARWDMQLEYFGLTEADFKKAA